MKHQLSYWGNPWRPAQDWYDLSPVFDVMHTEEGEGTRTHLPACEVEETKEHFLITLDFPGVNKEEIKVSVEKGRLKVSAERKQDHLEQKENRFFSERRYGKFERIFELGDHVDSEKIEADYQDGVLKIRLGKAARSRPREIPVGSSETRGLFGARSGSKEKVSN